MQSFSFQNKGRLLFGEDMKGAFARLAAALSNRALVVCGAHFSRSGELAGFEQALEAAGVRVWVEPDLGSPSIEQARAMMELCRRQSIGLVIGVGGATAMDFAKIVAYGAAQKRDVWPEIEQRGEPRGGSRLALATVPTYPSSGSDMDGAAEMVEKETGRAGGLYGELLQTDLCWLNPGYATGIPSPILAYGAMTAVIQAGVAFLSGGRCSFAENASLAASRTILSNLAAALRGDREAIGELQLAACMNGFGTTSFGKKEVDFSLYFIEGIIENYWEIPYVPAITILFPHWLRSVWSDGEAFRDYFRLAWGVDTRGLSGGEALQKGLDAIHQAYDGFGIAWTLQGLKPMNPGREKLLQFVREPGPCESSFRAFTEDDIAALILEAQGRGPINPRFN
ncbi:iron-containing alcohol dehydrogenase [Mesosutterella sp. OilRF-GAM-744-9]|uniref:Iron-containing alcohol dehydrogenase n=1 Tax=Mesosutterella porci TaxID=2915351 RepID=A0ABS9MQV7_9BURK|nr:iron-containing alcohol dehydrogenase [Mesosutterella sp. oilRF-744-WT-GAM-9]MCG5031008.1 iron-containing alcohol dehydrogenase [Mesosutterella sp. oilRF-744-WT-GAM-9]